MAFGSGLIQPPACERAGAIQIGASVRVSPVNLGFQFRPARIQNLYAPLGLLQFFVARHCPFRIRCGVLQFAVPRRYPCRTAPGARIFEI